MIPYHCLLQEPIQVFVVREIKRVGTHTLLSENYSEAYVGKSCSLCKKEFNLLDDPIKFGGEDLYHQTCLSEHYYTHRAESPKASLNGLRNEFLRALIKDVKHRIEHQMVVELTGNSSHVSVVQLLHQVELCSSVQNISLAQRAEISRRFAPFLLQVCLDKGLIKEMKLSGASASESEVLSFADLWSRTSKFAALLFRGRSCHREPEVAPLLVRLSLQALEHFQFSSALPGAVEVPVVSYEELNNFVRSVQSYGSKEDKDFLEKKHMPWLLALPEGRQWF